MSIIVALLVFSVLIIVHEWGHYIAAVKCGVHVEEFAIGMGPAIYKKQGKKTLFSIRCLPIGGYCKMTGEDEASDDVNAFCNKNVWQKILIVVAGAAMNIIFAILVLMIIPNFMSVATTTIANVKEESPADKAGLKKGDKIIGVNGKRYSLMDDIKFELALSQHPDDKMDFMIDRNGEELNAELIYKPVLVIVDTNNVKSKSLKEGTMISEINGRNVKEYKDIKKELEKENIKVKLTNDANEYTLNKKEKGVLFLNKANRTNYIGTEVSIAKLNPLESMVYGLNKTGYYVSTTYKSLKLMVTGKVSKDQVSGPVGIIKMIGDTYNEEIKTGIGVTIISLLSFAAMLSINLGVVNLLPLPALDGGRFFILLIEAIRRKPMDQEKESWIHFVGFVLLMILMVLIVGNDIIKIIATKGI